jgi:hypothetical protein
MKNPFSVMVDFAIRAEHEEGLLRLESIQSLLAASSAHPHDHHVRHARRPADYAREWNRVDATPAAGIRDHRQAPLEPDPDALLGQGVNGLKARLEIRSPR